MIDSKLYHIAVAIKQTNKIIKKIFTDKVIFFWNPKVSIH